MFDKINIKVIVVDHLQTLRAHDTQKTSRGDLALFFVVPFLLAGVLLRARPLLAPELVDVLATSLSVFAALLFNLILLMYDIMSRTNEEQRHQPFRHGLIQEVYKNVSFCILVAVVALLLLLISFFSACVHSLAIAVAFLVYYFVGVFILSLFMVLKRIHVLLHREAMEPH